MKKIVFIAFTICAIGTVIWFWQANSKINTCKRLTPGITIDKMRTLFGEPMNIVSEEKTTIYLFQSNSVAAGPIRATIEYATGRILVLKCTEDEPPEWIIE